MSAPPYLFDARSAAWQRTTGWERYARELARRLADDPEVEVRVAGSEKLPDRLWQDLAATPRATRRARVAHFPSLPPAPWARAHRAVVYTLHDLTWWRWRQTASRMGKHYYARLASTAAHSRAHLVVDAEAVRQEVIEYFGRSPDSVTVVPLGVELPPAADVAPRRRPYLLAVGTSEPRKNLQRLVQAYELSGLSETHDLLLIGRAGWGSPPPGVLIESGYDDAELVAAYRDATAVVLPSLYEGFGLPAVEAMQLGTPVICSDIPVLREVTGGHAVYVDPTDVEAIAAALRSSPSLSSPAGAAAWARATFCWDRAAAQLTALYRTLDAG